MYWGVGNRPIISTQMGFTANPSTSALLAEVDFNSTMATAKSGGEPYQVSWIVAAQTTMGAFALEHVLSTGLDMTTAASDTRVGCAIAVVCSSGASAQFVTRHIVNPKDRFRVRMPSSVTGSFAASISAESMS